MALILASLVTPRLLVLTSSAAEVSTPLIWFSKAVLAFIALVRAVRSTRNASTYLSRALGVEVPRSASTDSAAW